MSDGAILVREYGLPCLMGVDRASSRFKTGEKIALDCQTGLITKVNEIFDEI